jgi:hypothetical protein
MAATQRTPPSPAAAEAPNANYPSLSPAYTFNFRIGGPASPVGGLTRGQPLTVVHIVGGRVSSAPRQPVAAAGDGGGTDSSGTSSAREVAGDEDGLPRLEATVRGQGIDFVRNDPDGGRMRLDAGLVVEDGDGAVSLSSSRLTAREESRLAQADLEYVIDGPHPLHRHSRDQRPAVGYIVREA